MNDAVLRHRRRTVQLPGNIAATVIRPRELRAANSHQLAGFGKAPEGVPNEERIEHEYYCTGAARSWGSFQASFQASFKV